jgi:hypothetical protein
MEGICTHIPLEDAQIKLFLQEIFPGLKAFQCDFQSGMEPEIGFNAEDPSHILFENYFNRDKLEFGTQITIYRSPDAHSEERAMFIARKLSQKFNSKTLIAYDNPEDPSPYYVLVFQNGQSYLASDVDSGLADEGTQPIKIIREISLPSYQFDGQGQIV